MEEAVVKILTTDAIEFLEHLAREFRDELDDLLLDRENRQNYFDEGYLPDFLPETKEIRDSDWTVAPIPKPLQDRRVEITGPTDRKMVINALNSDANVFMADFEDSLSPTWSNVVKGQMNLRDAVRGVISYEHPTKGTYTLNPKRAVLFVRPRGLHMKEGNFEVDGVPIPASLFDFGLFMFHNAATLIENGFGPYFYIPKLEHYLEARWWNDVFKWTQDALEISRGSIRATVLIETLPAAFQMNEILHELKDHSAGLNCGRWDYIFSFIKTFRNHPDKILPDRSQVTMDKHFMRSYAELLIYTCHRRGIHAMGGMAAQIPIKGDDAANSDAMTKVRQDKTREAKMGHDGTWVAHPGLIETAKDIFDIYMPGLNQISRVEKSEYCTQKDLLEIPKGSITNLGLVQNISIGVQYIEAWLNGNGCVPLYNLMEDAATAEISRTQVWQWLKNRAIMNDGKRMNLGTFKQSLSMALASIKNEVGDDRWDNGNYHNSAILFERIVLANELPNFLTLIAYEKLIETL